MFLYRDRAHAGLVLAKKLANYANRADVLVLALPRGGVPVGFEVARALHAPLDVFVVRKLGVPGQEELAMGAIATGGILVVQPEVMRDLRISDDVLNTVASEEQKELERREEIYRGHRPKPEVKGRTIILVDDGMATGSTMLVAVAAIRKQSPESIIVAVPVAAASTCMELEEHADEVVCAETPEPFRAVGLWYAEFPQVSDEEVRELLARDTRHDSI